MARIELEGCTVGVEVIPAVLPMDTLFIHGNLASNRWWQPSIEIFRAQAKPGLEGRAILAEWRGCGESSHPRSSNELDIDILADDYIHLLNHFGIHKSCLVGHSTGGLIGLVAMLRKPELFHRAVMLDSVSPKGIRVGPAEYAAFTRMSETRAVCELAMAGTIRGVDKSSEFFQCLVDDAFNVAKMNWLGVPAALASINISAEIGAIMQPTLILHGEFDTILPKADAKEFAAKMPRGVYRELAGRGHSPNVENALEFVEIANQFLFELA